MLAIILIRICTKLRKLGI